MQKYPKICKNIQKYPKICKDIQKYAKISLISFLSVCILICIAGRHLELTSPITSSTTGGGHSSHPSHLTSGGISSNQQQQLPSSSSLHPHPPHSQSAALKSPASAAALFSHFYEGGSNPVTQNPRLQPPSHLYPRTPSKFTKLKFHVSI